MLQSSPAIALPSRIGAPQAQKSSTLRFYGDEFLFDTLSGMFYRMSPTACFMLRALDGGAGIDALPALLQTRYALDHATATRDAELFLNELAALDPLNRLHPARRSHP